jgi:hypothetical protein
MSEAKDVIKMVKIIDREGRTRYAPLEKEGDIGAVVRTLPEQQGYQWVVRRDNPGTPMAIVESPNDIWGK